MPESFQLPFDLRDGACTRCDQEFVATACAVGGGIVADVKTEEIETLGEMADVRFGLAAAAVRKPTVAQYSRYFSYLQVAKCVKESGPYGEAPRHEMIVMLGNFPEKGGSMRERRVQKSLKRHNLSSASFPKRLLLGRVGCSSYSRTMALLP